MLEHGTFEVKDLQWICRVLQVAIRVSMPYPTFKALKDSCPGVFQDMIFGEDGEGEIGIHLYFSFQKAVSENRHFGHYNLLIPGRGQTYFADPALWLYIYICIFSFLLSSSHICAQYINIYIYIYIFKTFDTKADVPRMQWCQALSQTGVFH